MKRFSLVALVVVGLAGAVQAGQPLGQYEQMMAVGRMMAYADRALIIAETPMVTLRFDDSPRLIDEVATKLRDRGYKLDEEAMLLNPDIINILRR